MSVADKPTNANSLEAGSLTGVNGRMQSIRSFTLVVAILFGLSSLGLFLVLTRQPSWNLAILSILYAASTGYGFFTLNHFYPRGEISTGLGGLSLTVGLALLASAALMDGVGFLAAIIFLIFSLIVSSSVDNDRQANLAVSCGIIVAGASALLTDYSPFPRASISLVEVFTPAILGVLFMVYVVMLAMQFVSATLRVRLVTAFLAIVIVPLTILSLIQSRYMFGVLSDETNQALALAAQQTALSIDNFMEDTQRSVIEAARLDTIVRYLELPEDERPGSPEEQAMRTTLQVLDTSELNSTIYLSSYALLGMDGTNLYDSYSERHSGQGLPGASSGWQEGLGQNEGDQDYFLVPARAGVTFISPVQVMNSSRGFFYISAPVKNRRGRVLGVLRVRYDGLLLQDLVKRYNRLLGENSYAILLDENNIRLADALNPNHLYKSVAPLPAERTRILKENRRLPRLPDEMLSTNYEEFDEILTNYEEQPFFTTELTTTTQGGEANEIGAITRTRTMPWKVVYLQTDFSTEALRQEQRRLSTLVTTLITCLVGLIAVATAQLLSSPIILLTHIAQQISAGDFEAQAPMQSSDEFGMLGRAFNLMTAQLRSLIAQLEERVKIRTQEIERQNEVLARRARQLQTVSEVARQIVSAQELETLLSSVTELVSERFNFDHVGIFLVDENREFAVLRAANSEGGKRMLARHHRLPIGKVGIVGYTTGTGQPRIATDVGEDAVFFNNPDLPNTRSEMALPLKTGDQVIGALDIQHSEPNAFQPEDIELFTTLADQIAIAIYNNQLYTETRRALDEAQSLHRQYLRSEWAEDAARRRVLGYLFNQNGVAPQQMENPLWQQVFSTGEPVYTILQGESQSSEKAVMAIPIAVRGETIGVIHVQDQGEGRLWSEDEVTVVNSIAGQVAVALENARLFENTVRRAEREKKVLQITAAIRSTNDPEEMLRIAVNELQQALRATRSQIYIRQSDPDSEQASPGSNGRSHSDP